MELLLLPMCIQNSVMTSALLHLDVKLYVPSPPQEFMFEIVQYIKLKEKIHEEGVRTKAYDRKSWNFSVDTFVSLLYSCI